MRNKYKASNASEQFVAVALAGGTALVCEYDLAGNRKSWQEVSSFAVAKQLADTLTGKRAKRSNPGVAAKPKASKPAAELVRDESGHVATRPMRITLTHADGTPGLSFERKPRMSVRKQLHPVASWNGSLWVAKPDAAAGFMALAQQLVASQQA